MIAAENAVGGNGLDNSAIAIGKPDGWRARNSPVAGRALAVEINSSLKLHRMKSLYAYVPANGSGANPREAGAGRKGVKGEFRPSAAGVGGIATDCALNQA